MDIKEGLEKIFKDVFDDDEIKISQDITSEDIEEWDSLMNIQLIVQIEKTFKIKFITSEIGRLKNVGEMICLIQHKISRAEGCIGK